MEEEAEKLKELQNEVEKQMNMSPPPGNAGPVIMSLEEKMEADARSIYVGNVSVPPPHPHFIREAKTPLRRLMPRIISSRWITGRQPKSLRPTSTAVAPSTGSPSSVTSTLVTPRGESGVTGPALSLFRLRAPQQPSGRRTQEPARTRPGSAPQQKLQTASPLLTLLPGFPQRFAYIEFSDKESVRTSLALDESLFRGRQIKVIPKRTNRPGISTTDRGFPRTRYRGRGSGYSSSRARFYSGFSSRPPRGRAYRSDPLLSLGWGCGGSAAQRRWAAHGWRRASALRAGGRIPGCPGPKATWQAKEVGWELQPLVLAKDSLSAETTVRWKRTVQIGRELGH
uniref:RRM domain-containing protein n=1 Tax=Varanus komodoensis TaxID=61221 RepID=A0A8D2JHJ6_VARKO